MPNFVDTAAPEWRPNPTQIALSESAVHIWMLQLDPPSLDFERVTALLSEDERARAARFVRSVHGRRFAVAHAGLRLILAKYLSVHPDTIEFESNEYGKPSLVQPSDVAFNLSHSEHLALVAVTSAPAIGVDIERYRDRLEADKIAKRHFSEQEIRVLFELPVEHRERAFYACWTRKEAYIKARGEGLSLGLDRFDVAFAPGVRPALLRSKDGDSELDRWSFFAFETAERYAAACAVEGPLGEVSYWDGAGLNPDG